MRILRLLYKYGCPLLLVLIFLFSTLLYNHIYFNLYKILNELIGTSILVCLIWIFEGYLRRRCKWYIASVYGLLFNCIINLFVQLRILDFNKYIELFKLTGLTISIIIVIYFILKEEYGINLYRYKPNEH